MLRMTALVDRSDLTVAPPPSVPVVPSDERRNLAAASSRWRSRLPLISVTAVSLVLNTWALSVNGLGNQYYAAATRSMTMSWSNFFFASFDPGGFISVDKPPVALWIAAASARLFGVNSWSLLLPSAIAGAAAVALLWSTINRRFGMVAATIAALVLALSPINVAVNRLNLPEPFLIFFLVAAAWAVLRSMENVRPYRWLLLAGVFVGLAFNTKMLAAYIPLPAVGLAILCATEGWFEKIKRGAVFGLTSLFCSVPWIVAVDLVPAPSRPYVGGSTNNTVLDLVFGYNGIGRVSGGGGLGPGGAGGAGPMGGGPGGGSMGAAGGVMGGSAGPLRLFSDALGGQIAWLLPLALLGAVAAFWLHRRDRLRRSALILWAGWLALYAAVFSYAGGTFHAYYTSVMTPAIAACVGVGAAALVALVRRNRWWFSAIGAGAFATLALQLGLADREPDFYGWTRPLLVVAALSAAAVIVWAVARRRGRIVLGGLAVAMAAALIMPAAWAVSETANPVLNSTLPQAGPRTGSAGSTFGSVSSNGDPSLAAYLRAQHRAEKWDLVVASAQVGSGLIADEDISVLSLGGFMGTDRTLSVPSFADLVAAGDVRFVLVSGSNASGTSTAVGRSAGGPNGGPSGGSTSSILSVVARTCTPVTATSSGAALPAAYRGSIYDCAGHADAIRAAAN